MRRLIFQSLLTAPTSSFCLDANHLPISLNLLLEIARAFPLESHTAQTVRMATKVCLLRYSGTISSKGRHCPLIEFNLNCANLATVAYREMISKIATARVVVSLLRSGCGPSQCQSLDYATYAIRCKPTLWFIEDPSLEKVAGWQPSRWLFLVLKQAWAMISGLTRLTRVLYGIFSLRLSKCLNHR